MREAALCHLLITRRTFVNVTQPVLSKPSTVQASSVSPYTKEAETTIQATLTTINYPMDNSILSESTSAEKQFREQDEKSSRTVSIMFDPVNADVAENNSATTLHSNFQMNPSSQSVRTTVPDSSNIFPVTAAQDITQFEGIDVQNSSEQKKASVFASSKKTISSEQNDQAGELVGSVVFPPQSSPSSFKQHVSQQPQLLGTYSFSCTFYFLHKNFKIV